MPLGWHVRRLFGLVMVLGSQYCWAGDLPADYPAVFDPPDNPTNPLKVALGKRLFFDRRLSINTSYSCASCHLPEKHFTDGRKRAVGALGDELSFNTPTLLHSAYNASFGWTDLNLTTLEAQHQIPLTGRSPIEMGFNESLLPQLNADIDLRAEFAAVFDDINSITLELIIKALASYVRSLVSPSAFDQFLLYGDTTSLTPSAKRGLRLFTSERLGCLSCHNGFNLGGALRTQAFTQEPNFHRRTIAGKSLTLRTPSLRSVSHTAPYFHDGELPTLDAVLDFYEQGAIEPLKPFTLSAEERREVIEFLKHL